MSPGYQAIALEVGFYSEAGVWHVVATCPSEDIAARVAAAITAQIIAGNY